MCHNLLLCSPFPLIKIKQSEESTKTINWELKCPFVPHWGRGFTQRQTHRHTDTDPQETCRDGYPIPPAFVSPSCITFLSFSLFLLPTTCLQCLSLSLSLCHLVASLFLFLPCYIINLSLSFCPHPITFLISSPSTSSLSFCPTIILQAISMLPFLHSSSGGSTPSHPPALYLPSTMAMALPDAPPHPHTHSNSGSGAVSFPSAFALS